MALILGIETSCDETAASVVADGTHVRSHIVASQFELHEAYQGVVPEIASRAHLERIMPVIESALDEAGVQPRELDAIAVGNRPGLIGSLIVGVSAAKALAWSLNLPVIGVDHVQAHLHAWKLHDAKTAASPHREADTHTPEPSLGLVISGGHSSMYTFTNPTELQLIGRTIDDAIGEAFDKAAVILGLGYPGGPRIDKLAAEGDAQAYDLPQSMLSKDSLDFSFSGLKTALLYIVRGHPVGRGRSATFERDISAFTKQQVADLAASFRQAAVAVVIAKLERAVAHLESQGQRPERLVLGGGVSANTLLRERVAAFGASHGIDVCLPQMVYCVDNAAMIAGLAFDHFEAGRFDTLDLPAISTS